MSNDIILPISVEKFAAYLDNSLPDGEMSQIDGIISNNPELEELVAVSDSIDQDIQDYLSDDFLYEADTAVFEGDSFEIPIIDEPFAVEQQDLRTPENVIEEHVGASGESPHKIEVETEIFVSNEPQNIEVYVTGDELVVEQAGQEIYDDSIFSENTEAPQHNGGDDLLMDN